MSKNTVASAGCTLISLVMAIRAAIFFGVVYLFSIWANYEIITIFHKHYEFWKIFLSSIILTLACALEFPILVFGQLYIWFFMN